MNIEKLNQWLTLFANLGVLAGIVFLALEIRQSNLIAVRDSRTDIISAYTDQNNIVLENPSVLALRVKLKSSSPVLTAEEQEEALALAQSYMNLWINVNIGAQTGLIPEDIEQSYVKGALDIINDYPGMSPFILETYEAFALGPNAYSDILTVPIDRARSIVR